MTATCAVLHCELPGAVPVDLHRPEEPELDTLVCTEHGTRIERGEHWAWSEQVGAVLLGEDLENASSLPAQES